MTFGLVHLWMRLLIGGSSFHSAYRVRSNALGCDTSHCEGKGRPRAVSKNRLEIIDLNGSISEGKSSLIPWSNPDSFLYLEEGASPRCWTVYLCSSH